MVENKLDKEVYWLREKAHKHSNYILKQEGKIMLVDQDMDNVKEKLDKFEETLAETQKVMLMLQNQSRILKWLLGLTTSVLIAFLISLIK